MGACARACVQVREGAGSEYCSNDTWQRLERGRIYYSCNDPNAIAEEIISPKYLKALARLGAQVR
jgi:hypothetical protein